MDDTEHTLATPHSAVSEREKELQEKLGVRLLLIWLLGMIASVELLVIVHVLRH
jgi:hypothetical protein